jgi:peptidoglycan/xylan/chitin deacetylase (PgdA/CDA1 family)
VKLSTSLKTRIKSAAFFCLYYSGLEWLLARWIPVNAVAVLMYHGVCDEPPMPPHINFHHRRSVFERQMRLLKRRYRVEPLSSVINALMRGEPLRKSVVLTFDDGYRNNARFAAPILRKLRMPATIFVATAYTGTERWMPLNELYWRWSNGELRAEEMDRLRKQLRGRPQVESAELVAQLAQRPIPATAAADESFAMLNWDEIQDLADSCAEFGSHTHTHCNMAAEPPSRQLQELETSKVLLEARLRRPVRAFAYPYGRAEHISDGARASVIAAGYDCAITAEYGLVTRRSDRFALPRMGGAGPIWVFAGELVWQFFREAVRQGAFHVARPSRG